MKGSNQILKHTNSYFGGSVDLENSGLFTFISEKSPLKNPTALKPNNQVEILQSPEAGNSSLSRCSCIFNNVELNLTSGGLENYDFIAKVILIEKKMAWPKIYPLLRLEKVILTKLKNRVLSSFSIFKKELLIHFFKLQIANLFKSCVSYYFQSKPLFQGL